MRVYETNHSILMLSPFSELGRYFSSFTLIFSTIEMNSHLTYPKSVDGPKFTTYPMVEVSSPPLFSNSLRSKLLQ